MLNGRQLACTHDLPEGVTWSVMWSVTRRRRFGKSVMGRSQFAFRSASRRHGPNDAAIGRAAVVAPQVAEEQPKLQLGLHSPHAGSAPACTHPDGHEIKLRSRTHGRLAAL